MRDEPLQVLVQRGSGLLEQTKKIVLAVGDAGGKTKLRIPTFGAARKRGISKLESCVERRFALHGSSRHSAVIHP